MTGTVMEGKIQERCRRKGRNCKGEEELRRSQGRWEEGQE